MTIQLGQMKNDHSMVILTVIFVVIFNDMSDGHFKNKMTCRTVIFRVIFLHPFLEFISFEISTQNIQKYSKGKERFSKSIIWLNRVEQF